MNEEVVDATYEPFSREPEYVEVNRLFVENSNLRRGLRLLDLACGTGTVTALVLEQLSKTSDHSTADSAPFAELIGVDLSFESLRLAEQYLVELSLPGARQISWMQGSSEHIPLPAYSVDAVIIGNAIQLFEDKRRAIREIRRVLRDGGTLAFNTSFYAGCYVPGTERFYLRWVQEALSYIRRKDAQLRLEGANGVARKKGLVKHAFSNPWLSRQAYEELLVRNGFTVRDIVERTVQLTQRSLEMIGSYAGLAQVLLSGYPTQVACEALAAAAKPALAAFAWDSVPRYWIEFISSKAEVDALGPESDEADANVAENEHVG
jgi:ubiquinone/menaquinone biosynthesis C-methylase UbiE